MESLSPMHQPNSDQIFLTPFSRLFLLWLLTRCFLRTCKWTPFFAIFRWHAYINNLKTENTQNSSSTSKPRRFDKLSYSTYTANLSCKFFYASFFSWQPVDSYQLGVIYSKKTFLFIILLRVNHFSQNFFRWKIVLRST